MSTGAPWAPSSSSLIFASCSASGFATPAKRALSREDRGKRGQTAVYERVPEISRRCFLHGTDFMCFDEPPDQAQERCEAHCGIAAETEGISAVEMDCLALCSDSTR